MQATHCDPVVYKLDGKDRNDVGLISYGSEIDRGVAAVFDLSLEHFNQLPVASSGSGITP